MTSYMIHVTKLSKVIVPLSKVLQYFKLRILVGSTQKYGKIKL